ncbi:MAG: hypothetical protein II007_11080 [Gammaproteobacteria bacterium]|nr:hypothetical protein [Gammaproteobacteria bacterium]
MALMQQQIRQLLATMPGLDDGAFSDCANLIEYGLHSMSLLQLIGPLSGLAGGHIDYAELASNPTIDSWARLVEERRWQAKHSLIFSRE